MKTHPKAWQLQEAKNKFSQLVELAEDSGPQFVTKHGRESVVILSAKTYRKLLKPETDLVAFFQNSPLAELELELERRRETPRDIEL